MANVVCTENGELKINTHVDTPCNFAVRADVNAEIYNAILFN